jgi:type I restriction enzyme M protein
METELIKLGIKKGYLKISADGKKITYVLNHKTYNALDPEEIVRAEYYVELIEKYLYQPRRIDLEVVVPRRTPNDLADIVIYEDNEKLKPYIIIECKKDGISDLEFHQSIEQAFGNANSLRAPFTAVVAGNTRRFFDVKNHPQSERNSNIIADIPINYGKIEEFRYKKDDPNWDIKPVSRQELIRILQKCNDTLWDGGKMDPTEAFDELSKIIFVKIRDEQKARKKSEPYDFQIKTYETPESVHKRINGIYEESKSIDPDVFTESILSKPQKLFTVVNHLQAVSLSKTDLDTKGVAFEKFMEDFFKGKQGQYFTPREVVNFMIKICNISTKSKVLDPACGSGGFLLYSLDKIRTDAADYYKNGTAEHYKYWHDFAANNLYGIEVNEKIARVAKMNMIIHDDGHTNVICSDSLETFPKIKAINQRFEQDSFDFILTNPPFGAVIEDAEKPYLGSYDLGKSENGKVRDSQKSEILFIERCWQFLKYDTGKLAIILPDGILTNKTQSYVRDFIVSKFQIEAIFSLPQVTFMHYGAGVKSSIFLMRKKNKDEKESDYKIFSALVDKVGYDATGRKDKNELPDISAMFDEYKKGKTFYEDRVFVKKISEFNNNRLDAYYYSPMFEKILEKLSKFKYPLRALEEVCVTGGIANGKTPAKDAYSENLADMKIIKVATLKKTKVDLDFVDYVNPNFKPTKFVQDEDIFLLSAAHQASYIGKNPCILRIPQSMRDEKITYVGELISIRSNKSIVNPYFILQLLCTKNYFLLINREKRGQTSHLYSDDLKKIKIPVPEDIEIQNKNAQKYQEQFKRYEELTKEAEDILQSCINKFEEDFLK